MQIALAKIITVSLTLWASGAQAACRHALALGLDVSGSVDASEYRLQLDGVAIALNSPKVQDVLFRQPDAPVYILIYEWSGPANQTIILPWTALNTRDDLAQATAILHGHQRRTAPPTTAIGPALLAGFQFLDQQPDCWRRTLDLSGDGAANTGTLPQHIAENRTPLGAVVNGLVIGADKQSRHDTRLSNTAQLSSYYSSYVIRGPGAFVETALGFSDYAAAMERKLLRELQVIAIGSINQHIVNQ